MCGLWRSIFPPLLEESGPHFQNKSKPWLQKMTKALSQKVTQAWREHLHSTAGAEIRACSSYFATFLYKFFKANKLKCGLTEASAVILYPQQRGRGGQASMCYSEMEQTQTQSCFTFSFSDLTPQSPTDGRKWKVLVSLLITTNQWWSKLKGISPNSKHSFPSALVIIQTKFILGPLSWGEGVHVRYRYTGRRKYNTDLVEFSVYKGNMQHLKPTM